MRLTAVDLSRNALSLCRLNAESNNLPVPRLVAADLLTGSGKLQKDLIQHPLRRLSLVTCNPPYIAKHEFVRETALSVRMFEPKLALVGDMEFYANLVDRWLNCIESFVYEVGDSRQIEYVVRRITADEGLRSEWCVGHKSDSSGRPRVVYGFRRHAPLRAALGGYGELLHFASSEQ